MNQISVTFIAFGALLLIDLATDCIGRKTPLSQNGHGTLAEDNEVYTLS